MFGPSNWVPSHTDTHTHTRNIFCSSKENKLCVTSSDYRGVQQSTVPLSLLTLSHSAASHCQFPCYWNTELMGAITTWRSSNGSWDILRKHNSDESEPDTHTAELAAKRQVAWTGTGKTKKVMKLKLLFTWIQERDGSVKEAWPPVFTHSGKYVAEGTTTLTCGFITVCFSLRFPLQMAQIFHINLQGLCKRRQFCNEPYSVLVIKRSQFIIILSAISLS